MKESVDLPVVGADGHSAVWVFECVSGDTFSIVTHDIAGAERRGSGSDWFDALRSLRISLHADGYQVLCAGSMVNARPSGMLSDTTQGEFVYLLEPNREARKKAWIFAPASLSDVGTVVEQDEFYERWLANPAKSRVFRSLMDLFREYYHRLRYR
ncbi:hypothetical protein GCM10010269_26230 [Streptomyces humidus]|uniref:Uncharacterized protein n=1 Tax=Streptomyces humidus TaxID=52259 RepID=A0A918L2Q5_9ACTN|nr:hypothetical protein [Streptomyces humidus]GGR85838.1 hypothetical protein GCM10010269_26230 [Streptomyces humidus]